MVEVKYENDVTSVWEDYRRGVAYQENIGLARNLPIFVDFYEGRQWPAPTENTKNLPRPVINLIKMICRNKKSAILSSPIRLTYRTSEKAGASEVDIEKFNRFAEYIQRELGQEELDKRAVHDAVRKGSYFYHYYWDADARGKRGMREGALRGELIDPLSIFFADPTEVDEQKQEWIIIATREHIASVRVKADEDVDKSLIVADENHDKYNTKEQDGDKLCTVLTRYFRKDGEVWFEKSTKTVKVNAPRPLSPDVEAAKRKISATYYDGDVEIDAPNNALPDSTEGEELTPRGAKAIYYPIVAGAYEPREKCIYGLGEVEGIIPNQKLINFLLGMMALSVQENAWGKYVVLPGALKGQSISNEPGLVLTDYTGTGNGIKRMSEQAIHSIPLEFIDTISNLTRVVTGSSEVMTGETLGASMSGAAIAQLQAQAQQPNEELKEQFHLAKEKQGKIYAQCFKLYYAGTEFTYEEDDGNGGTELKSGVFDSSEFANVNFEVVVEATAGTKSSAASDINMLETLFAGGHISLKTFVKAYPEYAISNRTELLRGIEADEADKLKAYEAQIVTLKQQIEQLSEVCKEQEKTVNNALPLINENKRLRESLMALYAEANDKIMKANEQIALGNAGFLAKSEEAEEAAADASEFALNIAQMTRG